MAENDEPIEDLRAVGMTAAATAARVAEILLRDAQDRARQAEQARAPRRHQEALAAPEDAPLSRSELIAQRRAAQVTGTRRRLDEAREWARVSNPEALKSYELESSYSDTAGGRRSAERALIYSWEKAGDEALKQARAEIAVGLDPTATLEKQFPQVKGHLAYDSTERREASDKAMQTAGVPVEAQQARSTSDLLNGTDPRYAAASGSKTPARPNQGTNTPERQRGR